MPDNPLTSLRVELPATLDTLKPIEIVDETSAMRAAIVERYALPHIPVGTWGTGSQGVYVLLSHLSDNENSPTHFTAYVGKTDSSFINRLVNHDKDKPWWRTAILFRKNSLEGFNRNQTAYLEGELTTALKTSPNTTVLNAAPTGDPGFPEWEKLHMETCLLSIMRVLFLRGYRNSHLGEYTQVLEETTQNPDPVPPSLYTQLKQITLEINATDHC